MKKDDLIDFLVLAAQQGASDLHLTPGAPPMIRVAGVIKPLTEDAAVLSAEDTRRLVIDALKEGQRAKLENEWQLDFALQVHDLGRYRGNACYVSGAIEANFRQIPAEIPDLKSLGHSPVVDKWCDATAGLVLVTGASGEGKSTTLASMAQTIACRRSVNMVSIEDPIEFVHSQGRSLVNQREVGSDVHSFAAALKNALRQDADVILVGELRDLDTIQTAITAAETGHLVIGTMHTNDAPMAIGRIIDAVPKRGAAVRQCPTCVVVVGSGVSVSPAAKRPDGLGFGHGIIDGELRNRGLYPGWAAFADTGADSNRRQGRHAY